jgi:hypothetical protein
MINKLVSLRVSFCFERVLVEGLGFWVPFHFGLVAEIWLRFHLRGSGFGRIGLGFFRTSGFGCELS